MPAGAQRSRSRDRGRDRGRDDYDRYDEGPRRDAYGQPYGGPPQGGYDRRYDRGYDRGPPQYRSMGADYDDRRGPPPQQGGYYGGGGGGDRRHDPQFDSDLNREKRDEDPPTEFINERLTEREKARMRRDFQTADAIREELYKLGVEIWESKGERMWRCRDGRSGPRPNHEGKFI